jgi:DNA-binding NarL/FixJ family response regulator
MAASRTMNKQIAQARFVTLKTVEGHQHHAYQKLDITSRSQLEAALSDDQTGATGEASGPPGLNL